MRKTLPIVIVLLFMSFFGYLFFSKSDLVNDSIEIKEATHSVRSKSEFVGNVSATTYSDGTHIISSDRVEVTFEKDTQIDSDKINSLIDETYQSLKQSGYTDYEREQLEEMANNGDGMAALGYIYSYEPDDRAFLIKDIEDNREKLSGMAHIAIRDNLLYGYITAANLARDPNIKVAYLKMADQKFDSLFDYEFDVILRSNPIYSQTNLDVVQQNIEQLHSDIFK